MTPEKGGLQILSAAARVLLCAFVAVGVSRFKRAAKGRNRSTRIPPYSSGPSLALHSSGLARRSRKDGASPRGVGMCSVPGVPAGAQGPALRPFLLSSLSARDFVEGEERGEGRKEPRLGSRVS